MKKWILLFAMFAGSAAHAQDLTCKVQKVFAPDYEDVNDFSFQDYEYLLVRTSNGETTVTVGALPYEPGVEGGAPVLVRDDAKKMVWTTRDHYVKWVLDFDKATKQAKFLWLQDGKWQAVAIFACED